MVPLPSEAGRPAAALNPPGLDRAQQAWQEQRKENELAAALGGMGTVGGLERACSSKVIQLNLKLSCNCCFLIRQKEYMKAKPETGFPQPVGGVQGQGGLF